MPLLNTNGNVTSDAYGGGVAAEPNYIESCFSTYLYTGNATARTITNGIDLLGKGGLVWIKARSQTYNNLLSDSATGPGLYLVSNGTNPLSSTSAVTDFTSSGFEIPTSVLVNGSGTTFASWTFRKATKFFDVATWTGDGTNARAIPHSLGSTPGFIATKITSGTGSWRCYHRALTNPNQKLLYLNLTNAEIDLGFDMWNPTSTTFNVDAAGGTNASGTTYVAYLFAHNAGGFGLTGTDNVISCGSYVNNSTVTLGYEPQWILAKRSDGAEGWFIFDTMRGMPGSITASATKYLYANTSGAEASSDFMAVNATGFTPNITGGAGVTYIYIAIRRGPMKVPTSGTSVFSPVARTGTGSIATVNVGFAPDFLTTFYRTDAGQDKVVFDRLRGPTQYLDTAATTQEINVSTNGLVSFNNTSFTTNANGYANNSGSSFVNHVFGRAPSTFDVVCYTGNDVAPRNINHNLTVIPEMMIVKGRSNAGTSWVVYHKNLPSALYLLQLESNAAQQTGSNAWRSTAPTASVFTVGNDSWVNTSGDTFVAYLWATNPGVTKVGSYTGTGSTQTINCGFTGGSRLVLIKRIDSTGDWVLWDSARGMVSGTDPRLALNSTAAEVNANWVYATTGGFQIVTSDATVNASGGSYIFLSYA